jgi:fucose 4-O-acetylase-like acetyltransferase
MTAPAPSPRPAARVGWVDYAKGIGIVLVVVGHALRGLVTAGLATDAGAVRFADAWIYAFHMPLFFVLAGLFVPRSLAKGAGRFVADKVRTVLYPYAVWATIQTGLMAALSRYTNNPATWADVAAIPWRPPMQFWFLYALFFDLLLYAALARLGLPAWLMALLGLGLHVLRYEVGFGPWVPANQVAEYFVFLAFGAWVGSRPESGPRPPAFWAVLAAVSYALLTWSVWRAELPQLYAAACGIAGTVAVAALLAPRDMAPWLRRWGELSLPIFVAHTLFSAAFRIALLKGLKVEAFWPHLIGGTLAGILGPVALVWAAERVGFRYLFAWPARRHRQ